MSFEEVSHTCTIAVSQGRKGGKRKGLAGGGRGTGGGGRRGTGSASLAWWVDGDGGHKACRRLLGVCIGIVPGGLRLLYG